MHSQSRFDRTRAPAATDPPILIRRRLFSYLYSYDADFANRLYIGTASTARVPTSVWLEFPARAPQPPVHGSRTRRVSSTTPDL